jgi:2-methylisocitrate lyase-like PEP mutase family enzyme
MAAKELRDLIESDELLITPEIYDGLSAKIAEDVGFQAAVMGGFAATASFGVPEPVVTMAEMRDRARTVANTTDLPFIIDGGTGFGNPAHTYRTVKEFANAGIAGVFIEDQVSPRQLAHHDGALKLRSVDEMEKKFRAAVDGREDSDNDIVILAKTQAATADRAEYESMEEAVDRINQYMDAGAELGCLYPSSREEAQYAVEHANGPLKFAVVPANDYCPTFEEVAEMGYKVANTPQTATVETAKHLQEYYNTLYESHELTTSGADNAEYKSYVYDLQYDGYENYE